MEKFFPPRKIDSSFDVNKSHSTQVNPTKITSGSRGNDMPGIGIGHKAHHQIPYPFSHVRRPGNRPGRTHKQRAEHGKRHPKVHTSRSMQVELAECFQIKRQNFPPGLEKYTVENISEKGQNFGRNGMHRKQSSSPPLWMTFKDRLTVDCSPSQFSPVFREGMQAEKVRGLFSGEKRYMIHVRWLVSLHSPGGKIKWKLLFMTIFSLFLSLFPSFSVSLSDQWKEKRKRYETAGKSGQNRPASTQRLKGWSAPWDYSTRTRENEIPGNSPKHARRRWKEWKIIRFCKIFRPE